ncbi:hypothetical protein ACE1ET_00900 [Saccharicrinis sp. FJH62]|uniref:hypothetical protein n=1 Tax=Saccharicrinis sp. FJH62 TaxID=3344657 RepID=UPI0035D41C5E
MKTKTLISIGLLTGSLLFGYVSSGQNYSEEKAQTVSVLYSPDLMKLATNLSESFNAGSNTMKSTTTPLEKKSDIQNDDALILVNDYDLTNYSLKESWKMAIGRSVLVPLINKGNPFYEEVLKQGISVDELTRLLLDPQNRNWHNLLGESFDAPIRIFVENSEEVVICLHGILNTDKASWAVQFVSGTDNIQRELKNNKNAIALCLLSDIHALEAPAESSVHVLPIDKNANGFIDDTENIYTDLGSFQRGVWIGKYPKALYSSIYLVSLKQTIGDENSTFIKWVITKGQPLIAGNGYQELVYAEIPSKLSKLNEPVTFPISVKPDPFIPGYILIPVVLILLTIAGIELLVLISRRRKSRNGLITKTPRALELKSLTIPQGVYFDKTHTWAFLEKNGSVRIGLDDFLAQVSGPVSRVIMKSEGEKITKGEHMLTLIQDGKQIKVSSPVSGTVQAFNSDLIYDVSKLNDVPYDEGWVYEITPDDWNIERIYLNSAFKYKEWITQEFSRFKDFITNAVVRRDPQMKESGLVFQDGGELLENTLSKMGPDVWEEFQCQFLDR